jgi:hypothetical protein
VAVDIAWGLPSVPYLYKPLRILNCLFTARLCEDSIIRLASYIVPTGSVSEMSVIALLRQYSAYNQLSYRPTSSYFSSIKPNDMYSFRLSVVRCEAVLKIVAR